MIVDGYVDEAGIGGRLFILPGEIFLFVQTKKKSAEVIVVAVTSRAFYRNNTEVSQKQRRTKR